MVRRSNPGRKIVTAAVTLIGLAAITIVVLFLVSQDDAQANLLSGTYSFYLALAAAAIPVGLSIWRWALRKKIMPTDEAASTLRIQVLEVEQVVRQGLVGNSDLASWSFGRQRRVDAMNESSFVRQAMRLFRYSDANGRLLGDLSEIDKFYDDLESKRMVVIGDKGSGKTVAAVQLVLKLMGSRNRTDGSSATIPVRFDMANWDPRFELREWMARDISARFSTNMRSANELVSRGMVLPILDGLDEMDNDTREPGIGPDRAIAAVEQLNSYFDSDKLGPCVVLTRPNRYLELEGLRLAHAREVYVDPLTPDQIATYLTDRYANTEAMRTWRRTLSKLFSNNSELELSVLSTPWKLLLATTAVDDGQAPDSLFRRESNESLTEASIRIESHLLRSYVSAATRLSRAWHSAQGQDRKYYPEQVEVWLVRLSRHLTWQHNRQLSENETPPGLTGSDIVPHLVWPIQGFRTVRAIHSVFSIILTGVPLFLWTLSAAGPIQAWPALLKNIATLPGSAFSLKSIVSNPAVVPDAILLISLCAAVASLQGAANEWPRVHMNRRREVISRRTLRARLLVLGEATIGGVLLGTLVGAIAWIFADFATALVSALITLAIIIAAFARSVLFGEPEEIPPARPYDSFRLELPTTILVSMLSSVVVVLLVAQVRTGGLIWAAVAAIAISIVGNASLSLRYLSMVTAGIVTGSLPARPRPFFEWCCAAGLLRFAGASYQFRHIELEEWLRAGVDSVVARTREKDSDTARTSDEEQGDEDERRPEIEAQQIFDSLVAEALSNEAVNRYARTRRIPISSIRDRLNNGRDLVFGKVDEAFARYSDRWGVFLEQSGRFDQAKIRIMEVFIACAIAASLTLFLAASALLMALGITSWLAFTGGALICSPLSSLGALVRRSRYALAGAICAIISGMSLATILNLWFKMSIASSSSVGGIFSWVILAAIYMCWRRRAVTLKNREAARMSLRVTRDDLRRQIRDRGVRPAVNRITGLDPWSD